ncbi:MAG: hypothetical protein J1F37_05225 [Oscillospiraceae bacterium]|nr:hypothetical protein [Oscillospiraceae bacterium]
MTVKETFKYGRTCYLSLPNGWNSERFKAFVQPLRYKTKLYLEGYYTEIGVNTNSVYLYLGPANHDLTRLSSDARIVDSEGNRYMIDKAEEITFKDKRLYIWAVIRKTTEKSV